MSVNLAIIMGNVGRDPEIRSMRGGDEIANLSVATSDSWKDRRTGERVEKTEWHRVSVFNPHIVGVIKRYVKKGTKVYIEGTVQTRKWTGQDGVERLSTEVVIKNFGGRLDIVSGGAGSEQQPQRSGSPSQPREKQAIDDDEIPF